MSALLSRLVCAVGLHKWHSVLKWHIDESKRLRTIPTKNRVCATCGARGMYGS